MGYNFLMIYYSLLIIDSFSEFSLPRSILNKH